jgi:hypothetical protein
VCVESMHASKDVLFIHGAPAVVGLGMRMGDAAGARRGLALTLALALMSAPFSMRYSTASICLKCTPLWIGVHPCAPAVVNQGWKNRQRISGEAGRCCATWGGRVALGVGRRRHL